MNIIPANQSVPFSVDKATTGLFVGMLVYDMTSGTPVQITGQAGQTNGCYPMTGLNAPNASNSYQAFFKGSPQRTYLMIFQQFTDGTYVTPTGASTSTTVASKFVAPVFVQNLECVIGCEDQPTQKPVVTSQNSDGTILLTFVDEDGAPVDITAATIISLSVLEADGATVLAKTLGSGVTLVSGVVNQALVSFLAADFALLPEGNNDAQVALTIAGVNNVLNCYSAIEIQPSAI